MNTTFNINRLGLLLKRYFIENKQRELSFWGIATVVFMLSHNTTPVTMFMYIAGMIFAANSFKIFSHTPGGMHYLLIPATHTEKLVTSILLSTFYYFAMFMITYTVGTIVGINVKNLIFGIDNPVVFDLFQSTESGMRMISGNVGGQSLLSVFTFFATIQAIFMLGSLYFKRSAVGKTILSIIALGFVLGIIEIISLKSMYGTLLRSTIGNNMANSMISINLSLASFKPDFLSAIETVAEIFSYLVIPFFWIVSYFRLTEKQV